MNLKPLFTTSLLCAGVFALTSCDSEKPNQEELPTVFPASATVDACVEIKNVNGVKVYNGGFGSSAGTLNGYIYLMTDRGPNIDGASDEKIFSNPEFTPQIGRFVLEGNTLKLDKIIYLQGPTGIKMTGLPNPVGMGGNTGETPLGLDGQVLPFDKNGLDPEGMAIMKDGSFWISDEYGPHIIHFDSNGKEIERINAFDTARKIPAVFGRRRPNRGMEGMTITPNGKYLVGMMQSPLYNPDKSVKKKALLCRILFFDLATGKSKEFLYALDNKDMANSEIVAINDNSFLVLERDGEMPGTGVACSKLIYKIDVTGATDVTSDDPAGRMIGGKTIEQCTPAEVEAAGIKLVKKTLAFDIMSIPNYPHDKPEGLIIMNESTLAIINDDDFGISGVGTYEQKVAPILGANTPDKNIMYFVKPLISLK